MEFLQLLVVVLALAVCSSAHGSRSRGRGGAVEGEVCRPYGSRRTCGNRTLLSEEVTELTEGYGPNVCRTTRVYAVQTYSYTFQRRCSNCRLECAPNACDGEMFNDTVTKTECCEGFTTSVEDTESSFTFSFFGYTFSGHHHSDSVLRNQGCPMMLRDSVLDCLNELNLDSFVEQVLLEPALETRLANGNGEDDFTVFVPSNEAFEDLTEFQRSQLFSDESRRAVLESHIREGELRSKRLFNGLILQPLTASVLLHIGQLGSRDSKRLFVNGAEIEKPDACQARNGIVHVVNSVVPVSPLNIAQILDSNEEQFGIFRLLLSEAGILPLLNRTKSRTVFVPTNDAFQQLPPGAVECLLRAENSRALSKLVLIHISYPALYTSILIERDYIPTFTFYYLIVRNISGEVRITRAEIPLEDADEPARNGVIHVINEVINPLDFETLCPDLFGSTSAPTTALPTTMESTTGNGVTTTALPSTMATSTTFSTTVATDPGVGVTDSGTPFVPPGGVLTEGPEVVG